MNTENELLAPAQNILVASASLPPIEERVYEATSNWESYVNEVYQRTTICKQVGVQIQANTAGYQLTFTLGTPTLKKPDDLESLEQLALRLADLYKRLVVQTDQAGELLAVLNEQEIQQNWAQLSSSIQEQRSVQDQVTAIILAFLDKQLQRPDQLRLSLQNDYLYQALTPGCYQPPVNSGSSERTRGFVNFFDKVPLYFTETIRVEASLVPDQTTVLLHGSLDVEKTNVEAVRRLIAESMHTFSSASAPAPAIVAEPHFGYEAHYELAPSTNRPVSVHLSVFVRAGQLYNKQYTLTLTPLS